MGHPVCNFSNLVIWKVRLVLEELCAVPFLADRFVGRRPVVGDGHRQHEEDVGEGGRREAEDESGGRKGSTLE